MYQGYYAACNASAVRLPTRSLAGVSLRARGVALSSFELEV